MAIRRISRRDFIRHSALSAVGMAALTSGNESGGEPPPYRVLDGGNGLQCRLNREGGALAYLIDGSGREPLEWLNEPIRITLINEATGESITPRTVSPQFHRQPINSTPSNKDEEVSVSQRWRKIRDGLIAVLEFHLAHQPRTGFELTIELPMLKPGYRVFTPTERGAISVGDTPDYFSTRYGNTGWSDHRYFVLPLDCGERVSACVATAKRLSKSAGSTGLRAGSGLRGCGSRRTAV